MAKVAGSLPFMAWWACALASLTLLLSGCLRPYAKPLIDPSGARFPGITAGWTADGAAEVRVLFVHGMCTHGESDWITTGWDPTVLAYFHSTSVTRSTLSPVDGIGIYDREYEIGRNTISARFLVWSPLTRDAKATLDFDNPPSYQPPGQFTWKRATLNGQLKTLLLNDCLSDAVIYAGDQGSAIQGKLQDAICVALDGTLGGSGCDFPAVNAHPNRRIIVVTESLGSRMVFDAIGALESQVQGDAAQAALDEALSPVTEIFMLANQLPLLALARDTSATAVERRGHSLVQALKVIADARARHIARQQQQGRPVTFADTLTLVDFTDPNDLLSYRIPPNDIALIGPNARVVNVLVSNGPSYFGYVENPYPAHTSYGLNPAVLRLLFGGTPGGGH
jgi:hypothetical protein